MTSPVKLAMSNDFLLSYSKLSRERQKKVQDMIEKFKRDPGLPGLNLEKLQNAANANYHSVRVDQACRAIVLKPDAGNLFMLMWVDHHDDAYAWAARHQAAIHPETGAIQLYTVSGEASTEARDAGRKEKPEGLLAGVKDRELLRLGVPESKLALVRSLSGDAEVDAAQAELPQEAFEAIYLLAAGFSVEEVHREMEIQTARKTVDTTDYLAAMEQPDSQRRFAFVEDDEALKKILAAPLEQWRIFLHPSQRRLVRMRASGPVRVLGGAGTGKTVVAMHRAKWLVEHVLSSDSEKVLLTTYTKNLAADIQENLRRLCDVQTLRRIEVTNLDAWVHHFLKSNGYDHRIVFGDELDMLWANALNLAPEDPALSQEFYRSEWSRIIQPRGIETREAYLTASRSGRGRALTRRQRAAIWPVFEEYRAQLNERRWRELSDATRDARLLLEKNGNILPYRAVVLDEAQDMSEEVFRLIRQMVPQSTEGNDLFLVGDAHQRIYGHPVVLARCGIDIRGRGKRLRVNYRTTEETRRWAFALLKGLRFDDLDDGEDSPKGERSLLRGPAPEILAVSSFDEEVEKVYEKIKAQIDAGVSPSDICIIARTNTLVETYRGAFVAKGMQTHLLKRSAADPRDKPGLRFATMHRVKGLEFDLVYTMGVNEGVIPLEKALREDNPVDREESERQERSLLYVSGTRARKQLTLSFHGAPSRFML